MSRHKIRKKIKYKLIYWGVLAFIKLSYLFPRRIWLWFCGLLGSGGYYFAKNSREKMRQNLSIAFPDRTSSQLERMVKETFVMLGKNGGDVIRASKVKTLEEYDRFVTTEGYENFAQAQEKGKGVIFISGHLGAFDLQVMCIALRGFNPHIVGTPLKDERLNSLLSRYRNAHGAVAVERGKETFRMLKVLKSGGAVALLIDQDTKVKSVFVDFFNKPAYTPVGATLLAMKTGAAVVPMFIHLEKDGKQHIQVLPEVPLIVTGNEEKDLVINTQAFTDIIESQIRKYPTQWVWMHERWKTKPKP